MKISILFVISIIFKIFVISCSFPISCKFLKTTHNAIGSVYRCDTTNILETLTTSVTSIIGTHLIDKNNNDVTAIKINGIRTLSFIPQNFSSFFPNIKSITFYNSAIKGLFGDEFDEFPKLEYIDFQANTNLTTISSRLFEKTPNMIHIWFYNNRIEKVGRDLFAWIDVSKLKYLGFTNSKCISQELNNASQSAIISLINEIRLKCPYDDEELLITTTTSLATTTVEENLTCSDEKIKDLVCDLKDEVGEIQENLLTKDQRIDNFQDELIKIREEMQAKDDKIQSFESRMKWLEEEVLRMTTNPCACK
ncbi:hypothetical protein PVAND_017381 [Polypedilum vanderplanki]|uniref:Uncharacterized protein n=1 Tax=Polypedilum vanderplanki TaxID=319348 RepID=A0A9J6BJB2_POLVA|nr:hypothetical protein PVAND_017381 [Polypedilum vanderplanki]